MNPRTVLVVACGALIAGLVLGALSVSAETTKEWLVTSDADAGQGTLRWAIEGANESEVDDVIRFGSDMTVRPTSPLPPLSGVDIAIIGSSGEHSADVVPRVWIDGELAGDAAGLELITSGGMVRGLGIVGFQRYGIGVIGTEATGARIIGNWIGLRPNGGASPNRLSGVAVIGGARGARIVDNRIAGNSVPERTGHGIVVGGGGSVEAAISGNVIGIGDDGSELPNDDGILIVDSAQATIRGNTIGNSKVAGIELRDTRVPVDIDGNWIGVRRDGEVASNDVGVFLGPGSAAVRVGAGVPNVIAGNRVGIAIEQGAREAEIWRNWLGLVPSGQNMTKADLPTARVVPNEQRGISVIAGAAAVRVVNNYISAGEFGIVVDGDGTSRVSLTRNVIAGARSRRTEAAIDVRAGTEIVVGGDSGYGNHVCGAEFGIRLADTEEASVRGNAVGAGAATRVTFDSADSMRWGIRLGDGVIRAEVEGNEIAEIERAAISVVGASSQDNSLLGNRFGSSGIEIDLNADGPTANDEGDRDRGPNQLLNHPVITEHEVRRIGGNQIRSTIRGLATPGSYVQIYERATSGERVWVKQSGRADASGRWEAATLVLPKGEIRALAFTSAGATSEFSPTFQPAQRVTLTGGVNWFAWTGPSIEIAEALSPLLQWVQTVWVYRASEGGWRGWSPLIAGSLDRLRTGDVVRIELSGRASRDFFVPGGGEFPAEPAIDLTTGFNSVTWLDAGVDALDTLEALQPDLIGSVWQWDGDSWELIWPHLRGAWDPGLWKFPALWIRAIRDGALSLP